MQLQTWKIRGRGAFHFGEHGIGQEASRITWPSDSLFAALIARLVALRGAEAVEAWLGTPKQPKKPPFLLTSTFPYAGEVRFFPVPKAALRPKGDLPKGVKIKALKKVRFVSEGIYRRLLAGESLAELQGDVCPLKGEKAWVLKSEEGLLPKQYDPKCGLLPVEKRTFWAFDKRPRVAVGRAPNNSNLFHVGGVRFAEDCGLWFGVHWENTDGTERGILEALLADLGDAGLGAERSSGYGQAEIKKGDDLTLPDPDGGAWTTLSRYLPAKDEIAALTDPAAAYEIERVGGWMDGRGLRRRAVHLLQEGAVLGGLDKTGPYGSVEDVRPVPGKDDNFTVNHSVWRVGLVVAVGYGGAK